MFTKPPQKLLTPSNGIKYGHSMSATPDEKDPQANPTPTPPKPAENAAETSATQNTTAASSDSPAAPANDPATTTDDLPADQTDTATPSKTTPVAPAGPDYTPPTPTAPEAQDQATAAALPSATASANAFDALKYGFSGFGRNWVPFVLLTVIGLALSAVVSFLAGDFTATMDIGESSYETTVDRPLAATLIGQIVQFVISVALTAATFNGANQVCQGKKVSLGSLFSGIPWVAVTIAMLVSSVVMMLGTLLTLGLGIFVLPVFLMFAVPAVITGKASGFGSIARSFSTVGSNAGAAFGLGYLALAVVIVGLIACVLPGILVCMPATHVAIMYLYRAVTNQPVASLS